MERQTGATLIEVLVTVLILAVGLLGLSATQIMSLKNGNNTHYRYLAGLAAHEMADRIRANPRGLELLGYDNKTVTGDESPASCTTKCSPVQLANLDLYDWGQVISTNLPSGGGTISRSGSVITLTVTWQEQHTGTNRGAGSATPDNFSFQLVVEL